MSEILGKAILAAVTERTGGRKLVCGICGGTRWGINTVVNLPLSDSIGQIVIGGQVLPLAVLTCDICGNAEFLNILKLIGKEKLDKINEEVKAEKIMEEAQRSLEEKGKLD